MGHAGQDDGDALDEVVGGDGLQLETVYVLEDLKGKKIKLMTWAIVKNVSRTSVSVWKWAVM